MDGAFRAFGKIKSVFTRHPAITRVRLFGSRAKGNYRVGSDIDLVVMANSLALGELLTIEMELDDLLLHYTVDLLVFSKLDHQELIEHINRVEMNFYQATPL
jgi:predicted nucleotidyltransferase